MKRSALLLAFLVSASCFADKLDDFIKDQMKAQQVPGMVVEIVKNGKVLKRKAYGKADLELNVDMQPEDIFEIGSMTKQFTAVATMMLVEEGKISLDDPVSKYVEGAPDTWKGITIRHLLTHTSGLKEYVFIPGLGLLDEFDRATFLKGIEPLPLDFQPGETWAYSNTNFALLGIVIEKASGKPYGDFLSERILKPVGMEHTRLLDPDAIIPNRAHGYFKDQGKLLRGRFSMLSNLADGALLSTVDDLVKYDAALHGGRLLKPESFAMLIKPVTLNSGRTRPYGFGTFREPLGGRPFIGHHGASSGYSSGYGHFPTDGLTVVVLTNVYAINGQGMVTQIAEQVDPSLKPDPFKATTDPDPARTERVKTALEKLAAGAPDTDYLEPELTALMSTDRQKSVPGGAYGPFAKIQSIEFGGARPEGSDTVLTYRIVTEPRTFIVNLLYTAAGKLSTVATRAEAPAKRAA